MPIVIVNDWNVSDRSTANYDALVDLMGVRDEPPQGLLFHTAGFVDDGTWRVLDVWESQADADRFMQERLLPQMPNLPAPGGPPDNVSSWELHGWQAG